MTKPFLSQNERFNGWKEFFLLQPFRQRVLCHMEWGYNFSPDNGQFQQLSIMIIYNSMYMVFQF